MRIGFLTQALTNGGAEKVVSILASKLAQNGNDIDIISISREFADSYEIDKKVNLIKVKRKKNSILEFITRIITLRKIIKKNDYDVVISFTTQKNISLIIASLFLKVKIIISERNDPYNDPKSKILRLFRKIFYRFSDGYVFQTIGAMNYFPANIKDKAIIIKNPLASILPIVDIEHVINKIVMVSRLEKEKNIFMGIDAFEIFSQFYPDYILEIYGQGSIENQIQKYVSDKNLNDKVILKGFVSNIHEKLVNAKIFMLTSNYEGVSNALLEAVAMGIPSISTDHAPGGAREIITSGVNGFLVNVNDSQMLFEKMVLLVENDELRKLISQNGIKSRRVFDSDAIASEWINFIESVINK